MGLRINDSSRTTTTTTANDDYLLIDGTTNGTRKILASTCEYVANKEQIALDTSFTKYPCNNVVKSAIDLKADDSAVVHGTGNETISGVKTFSTDIINNANEILTSTTHANQKGIIKKGSVPFIHDFNYGNNGTVTTTGTNLFIGSNAGNLTMGSTATLASQASRNIGIGDLVLNINTTGFNNTGIGSIALLNNSTGNYNTAIGTEALALLTSGSYNIGIGSGAGAGASSGNNNTSTYSIYLGVLAKANANGDTNEVVIGYSAIGKGSNTATIGNTSVTDLYANQSGTATVHAGQVTCSPTLSSGTVAPTSTPAKIGDIYVDTALKHTYVANGTTSSANWIKQNGMFQMSGGFNLPTAIPDNVNRYFGKPNYTLTDTAGRFKMYPNVNCTVTSATINFINNVVASSETSSLYLVVNNTTSYLLSSSITNTNYSDSFNITGLSIPLTATDFFYFKWVTPTFVTNPTSLCDVTVNCDL